MKTLLIAFIIYMKDFWAVAFHILWKKQNKQKPNHVSINPVLQMKKWGFQKNQGWLMDV